MNNLSRSRAWRRAQRRRCIAKRQQRPHLLEKIRQGDLQPSQLAKTPVPSEPWSWKDAKQWKFLWRRSQKLARAKQLKQFYPRKHWDSEMIEIEDM